MAEPIPSPYQPSKSVKEVTAEHLRKIKEMIGVECVLVVTSDSIDDCPEGECKGHMMKARQSGFSEAQIRGIGAGLAEDQHVHGDECA